MKQKMKKVRFGYNGHNQWSILMAPLFSKKKKKKSLGSLFTTCAKHLKVSRTLHCKFNSRHIHGTTTTV